MNIQVNYFPKNKRNLGENTIQIYINTQNEIGISLIKYYMYKIYIWKTTKLTNKIKRHKLNIPHS